MRVLTLLLLMTTLTACSVFDEFAEPLIPPDAGAILPETPPDETLNLSAPPAVVLQTRSGTVDIQPFTYCWTNPNENIGLCVDGIVIFNEENALALDTVIVEFSDPLFTSGTISLRSPDLQTIIVQQPLNAGQSALTWTPDAPAGDYMLMVDMFWQNPDYGDAFYAYPITLTDD